MTRSNDVSPRGTQCSSRSRTLLTAKLPANRSRLNDRLWTAEMGKYRQTKPGCVDATSRSTLRLRSDAQKRKKKISAKRMAKIKDLQIYSVPYTATRHEEEEEEVPEDEGSFRAPFEEIYATTHATLSKHSQTLTGRECSASRLQNAKEEVEIPDDPEEIPIQQAIRTESVPMHQAIDLPTPPDSPPS